MNNYQDNNFSQEPNPQNYSYEQGSDYSMGQPVQPNYQQSYSGAYQGSHQEQHYQQSAPPYSGGNYAPAGMPYDPYAKRLPEEVSVWKYLGMMWVMLIPIVGFVLMIMWAFSDEAINRRNYARAVLLNMLIGVVLSFFLGGIIIASIVQVFNRLPQYIN